MLSPLLTSWRVHYERLQRSFARILQPYQSSVAYDDDLQHFFQDCFHLKDWIKNDPASGSGPQIEAEVQAERPLRIAADLANAAKHLDLGDFRSISGKVSNPPFIIFMMCN